MASAMFAKAPPTLGGSQMPTFWVSPSMGRSSFPSITVAARLRPYGSLRPPGTLLSSKQTWNGYLAAIRMN